MQFISDRFESIFISSVLEECRWTPDRIEFLLKKYEVIILIHLFQSIKYLSFLSTCVEKGLLWHTDFSFGPEVLLFWLLLYDLDITCLLKTHC